MIWEKKLLTGKATSKTKDLIVYNNKEKTVNTMGSKYNNKLQLESSFKHNLYCFVS